MPECGKIAFVGNFQCPSEIHNISEYLTFAAPLVKPACNRFRDVAQPGSALAWGARGRKFESCRPDFKKDINLIDVFFYACTINQHLMTGSGRSIVR